MLTDLVLVERPGERVVGGLDGDVADEGDAHVGVRLQAEGDDRDHDEEHRHHPSHLEEEEERLIDPAGDGSLAAQYNLHLFFDGVVCGESLGRAYRVSPLSREKRRQRCRRRPSVFLSFPTPMRRIVLIVYRGGLSSWLIQSAFVPLNQILALEVTNMHATSDFWSTDLGERGGVGLVEGGPYLGLGLLPPRDGARVEVVLEAELLGRLLRRRLLCVQVESLQHSQRLLGVPMLEDAMYDRV